MQQSCTCGSVRGASGQLASLPRPTEMLFRASNYWKDMPCGESGETERNLMKSGCVFRRKIPQLAQWSSQSGDGACTDSIDFLKQTCGEEQTALQKRGLSANCGARGWHAA